MPNLVVFFRDTNISADRQSDLNFKTTPLPFRKSAEPLIVSAKSFLILDEDSGEILVSKDEDVALPPASLTKIITALVSLDYYSLDQVIVVDKVYPIGRNMGLVEGEKLKVVDLMQGLLIHSANDAAYVLAKNYPGGTEKFIEAMNLKAEALGLRRTRFVNFDGEEDDGHYSTAFELAQMARLLIGNDFMAETVQKTGAVVTDQEGKNSHKLETTNELLGVIPEIRGLKTGWTEQAGECFIAYFELEKDGGKRGIITAVLGSSDRFGETEKMVAWVKRNISWRDL